MHISRLPAGLRTIPTYAFNGLPNCKITSFGSRDGSSALESIGTGAFGYAGTGTWGETITRIEVQSSVVTIYTEAFLNYGGLGLETAAFARYDAADDGVYGVTYSEMGFGEHVNIEALM